MGLAGNLEDLALSDIVQIIHLSRKTGTLILKGKGGEGTIVFQDGSIIQSFSPESRSLISDELLKQKIISEDHIDKALELQEYQYKDLKLPEIFVHLNLIQADILRQIIIKKIKKSVFELLAWKEGYFSFDLDQIDLREIRGATDEDTLLKEGLSPQTIFLEAAKQEEAESATAEDQDAPQIAHESAKETMPLPQVSPEVPPSPADIEIETKHAVTEEPEPEPVPAEQETEPLVATAAAPEALPDMIDLTQSVIIVDDELVFLDILVKKLTQKGYDVHKFMEIDEAMSKLKELIEDNIVPILISDLVFPTEEDTESLGGIEFLDQVNEEYPFVPFILMSDLYDPQLRYQAYEHGARNYLHKPDRASFKITELTREIQHFGDELALCIKNIYKERDRLQKMMTSLKTIKETYPSRSASKPPDEPGKTEQELLKMKQIFYELQNPKETSEVILLVLRLASEHLDRGILFLLEEKTLKGIGGYGYAMDSEPIISKITNFCLPLTGPSVFLDVIDSKKMSVGQPKRSGCSDELYRVIGKPTNEVVAVIPLISEGRIIAVYYGDNGKRKHAVDNLVGLEIFINQAGIALENALLQKKLKGKLL